MRYFTRLSPFVAYRDLRTFLSYRQAHELWFGILAIILTGLLLVGFLIDSRGETVYKSNIIYVQSWPLSRSDREIIAQQKIDQVKRDREDAELRARQLKLQRQFQVLDNQLKAAGI